MSHFQKWTLALALWWIIQPNNHECWPYKWKVSIFEKQPAWRDYPVTEHWYGSKGSHSGGTAGIFFIRKSSTLQTHTVKAQPQHDAQALCFKLHNAVIITALGWLVWLTHLHWLQHCLWWHRSKQKRRAQKFPTCYSEWRGVQTGQQPAAGPQMLTGNAKLSWIIPTSAYKMEILSESNTPQTKMGEGFYCINKEKKYSNTGGLLCWLWVKDAAVSIRPYIQVVDIQLKAKYPFQQTTQHSVPLHFNFTWLQKPGNNSSMAVLAAAAVIKDVLQPITTPLSHLFMITFIYYFPSVI